ncbi:MAG: hypothetical protein ACOX52_16835 [Verrucomicrobiota bacterium]
MPTRTGIAPDSDPTPVQTMMGLIGNHCLEETHEGAGLFGYPLSRTECTIVGMPVGRPPS